MLLSLNWLKQYVTWPAECTPEKILELLNLCTCEVEHMTLVGGEDKIVVGRIESIDKHPQADKLQICQTMVAPGQVQQIVCGGSNLRVGMYVPVALSGAKVRWHGAGELVEIAPVKLRGVPSDGMICAPSEIGLPPLADEAAILELGDRPQDIGRPLYEALGLKDVIYEVDNKSLTNRPDLFGHYGMARDIYAILRHRGMATTLQPYPLAALPAPGSEVLTVRIEDPGCRRYTGVKITGVRVTASPEWLQQRLLAGGLRPINNLVDVTNYLLLDLGQPLHAFDASLMGDQIVVRAAVAGEKMRTLDGEERTLPAGALLITDGTNPMALAGIMGGEQSKIFDQTTSVILESANFDPARIRVTATALGLRTDASARYEKNIDPEWTMLALQRAVEILRETCPELTLASAVADEYPGRITTPPLALSLESVNRKTGWQLTAPEVVNILSDLGCTVTGDNPWQVLVPSWRATKDLSIPEDLIEEVARIHGYDQIVPQAPMLPMTAPTVALDQRLARRVLTNLTGNGGYVEVKDYPFTNLAQEALAGNPQRDNLLVLLNPGAETQTHLKDSLILGLLLLYKENSRFYDRVALCEKNRVWVKGVETIRLAGLKAGPEDRFLLVKGDLEALFARLHLPPRRYEPGTAYWAHPYKQAAIWCGETCLGTVGVAHPQLLNDFKMEGSPTLFELDWVVLRSLAKELDQAVAPARFPAVSRDLAIVVAEETTMATVEAYLRAASPLLKKVELFDLYTGDKVGAGKKSLAFNLVFADPERTLSDEEINAVQEQIIQNLPSIGASLRS